MHIFLLASLPTPLVIDHMGRIDPAGGATGPAFGTVRRLPDGGNTWVKLSGIYMRSREGAPGPTRSASDVLLAWCGPDQTLQQVLVDTPRRLDGFS